MISELVVAGAVLLVLVFLSTIESAYESLSEVSLRVIAEEREASPRARFFRELLDHRRRFELILILGTQLSIAAIAILTFKIINDLGVRPRHGPHARRGLSRDNALPPVPAALAGAKPPGRGLLETATAL